MIDPKPIAAEREFTLVSMVRDRRRTCLPARGRRRGCAGGSTACPPTSSLDRERIRGWTIAHTIAWGFEPEGFLPAHASVSRDCYST